MLDPNYARVFVICLRCHLLVQLQDTERHFIWYSRSFTLFTEMTKVVRPKVNPNATPGYYITEDLNGPGSSCSTAVEQMPAELNY